MLGQNAFPLNRLALRIRRVLSSPAAWAAAACLPGLAHAGPTGENVVAGSAAISRPDANTTVIDQGTDKAIINWQSFSIGGKEYVQFVQPATSSIALNRVVGGNPSQILGSLSANGRVFLVNPHGVYFGLGATIDVGGLVASVQDIKNEDFLAGRYVFTRSPDSPDGTGVVNDGVINARDGGFVVLAGDYVKNTGVIRARLGTAVLASGRALTLNLDNNGLVSFAVDEATVSQLAGVDNAGQILADGGRVLITAKVANGLVATAVNNSGLVQAHSIAEKNGAIFLRAAGGNIDNSGTLDASGQNGAAGGTVIVSSDQDATLEAGSAIRADGSGSASGGTVRIVADGKLSLRQGSTVSAQGGSQDGKGGFVEISGHQGIDLMGLVSVGESGQLVIDPDQLVIANSSGGYGCTGSSPCVSKVAASFIEGQLNAGVDVTLVATDLITNSGATSITATNPSYANNLSMKIGSLSYVGSYGGLADSFSIAPNPGCGSGGVCTPVPGTGYINFTAGSTGSITLNNFNINIRGGVDLEAGYTTGTVTVGNVTSSSAGNVRITAGTGITVGSINASNAGTGGASIYIRTNGSGDVNLNGTVNAQATGTGAGASVNVYSGGNLNVNNTIAATGNGTASIFLLGQSIQIAAPVQAIGPSADIHLQPESFAAYQAQTVGSGILEATTGSVIIDGGEGSTPSVVNVKTDTPKVQLYYPSYTGSAPTSITVNNTAFAGPATLAISSGSFATGSFGDLAFSFAGPATLMDAPIHASSFKIMVNSGDLSVAGATISTTSFTDLSAPGGNVNVAGALLSAGGGLSIVAGGSIQDASAAGATLDAGSLVLEAGGDIALSNSSVNIDTGTVAVGSDPVLQDLMSALGIASPGANPNAYFRAGGSVALGSLTAYAAYPYLVFQVGGTVNPGSVITPNASEILAAFQAAAGTNTIGVADTSSAPASCAGGSCTTNFFNDVDFSVWKGTTIAVGSGTQTGDIYIDPINIGSKNFLCLTSGSCFGLTNVQSTGIVAALVGLVNFTVPLPSEFGGGGNDEDKLNYLFQEGGEGGGGAGSVTYNTSQGLTCE